MLECRSLSGFMRKYLTMWLMFSILSGQVLKGEHLRRTSLKLSKIVGRDNSSRSYPVAQDQGITSAYHPRWDSQRSDQHCTERGSQHHSQIHFATALTPIHHLSCMTFFSYSTTQHCPLHFSIAEANSQKLRSCDHCGKWHYSRKVPAVDLFCKPLWSALLDILGRHREWALREAKSQKPKLKTIILAEDQCIDPRASTFLWLAYGPKPCVFVHSKNDTYRSLMTGCNTSQMIGRRRISFKLQFWPGATILSVNGIEYVLKRSKCAVASISVAQCHSALSSYIHEAGFGANSWEVRDLVQRRQKSISCRSYIGGFKF